MIEIHGFQVLLPVVVLGLVIGSTYGILAVGLVLVYRANRVINFAHGAIGALGAAVLGTLVVQYHWPYWAAFPAAIAVSALVGGLAELGVIRRLRNAPAIMSLVATLGLAAFLAGVGPTIYAQVNATNVFPQPVGLPVFRVGALLVTPAYVAMMIFTPLLVACLVGFLRRSRLGLALRAAASNPEAARTSAVFASRMSTLAWVIAGGISGYTAILVFPTRGFTGGESFGPDLLLRALAAAVVARMESLPVALAAGIGLGVAEQEINWNVHAGGVSVLLLFGLIVVALLVQRRPGARTSEKSAWSAVAGWPPVPDAYRRLRAIRWSGPVLGVVALAIAVSVPLWATNTVSIGLAAVMAFAIVALSIGVVSGQGGHLSLGQFAFAGLGAAASGAVSASTGNYILALVAAAGAGSAAAVLVGVPALRIRGVMFAVTTLAFGLMCQYFLLPLPQVLGQLGTFGTPTFGPFIADTGKLYYWWALAVLLVAAWLTVNVRRTALGRSLAALRDNEPAARAFTIPATVRTLQVFAISGGIAGIGGAVLAHALQNVGPGVFSADLSTNAVASAVIGGLQYPLGPLVGAAYVYGVPEVLPLDSAALAGSAFGWLLLVLYFPGGIGSIVGRLRRRLFDLVAARAGIHTSGAEFHEEAIGAAMTDLTALGGGAPTAPTGGSPVLEIAGVSKRYGGVRAVDDVSLQVRGGEILGLIGPNGAGKTTLFEIVSGFVRPDSGRVRYGDRDITRLSPEARGALGIVRSFQDSVLFPTLTVLETLKLAQERYIPTTVLPSLLGIPEPEAKREALAREVVHLMGLDGYRNRPVAELSTGTRRITELACVLSLRPQLLLLDEPSTGIAQAETEALGQLLLRIKDQLGATIILIEHDVPLVMSLADRVAAMESGRFICVDRPGVVRQNRAVIESYLGGDPSAIQRSRGATSVAAALVAEPT